jgi:hypothetical protein
MSVSMLLCEGAENSPDARLLGKLLAGRCVIKPMGGKYGMGDRISARRDAWGIKGIFGILDGDFRQVWQHPAHAPKLWEANDTKEHLGWRWERKEVENYLLDPDVVCRLVPAEKLNRTAYELMLSKARDRIADYQAARTALSASRRRFENLTSSFGKKRGKEKHPFPDNFDEAICRTCIAEIVRSHVVSQIVTESEVLEYFTGYIPECRSGGVRYNSYLQAFAGKDLLWAMDEDLKQLGFQGAMAFREKILVSITESPEDIASWLPEWNALRQAVESV